MNHQSLAFCLLLCGAVLPGPVLAQVAPGATPDAGLRQWLPVGSACPAIFSTLPERLDPAWRSLDSAAQVVVEFKLDGSAISDVRVSGGHGQYASLVRSAVRAMQCRAAGSGLAAVRFRISFVYPEDQPRAASVQLADEAPRLAAR